MEKIIGIIGGSGLYKIEGLEDVKEVAVETPFGKPSDSFITGKLGSCKLIFLPRHGRGHTYLPSEVNYAANIYGMKKLGVNWIIAVSAVGSMKKEIEPGHIVIPDQLIDRTKGIRRSTFFGDGVAGHIPFADPYCSNLRNILVESAKEVGAVCHNSGTYVCIEGPQFSTRAESNFYRHFGVSVIGMTNIPESKLAKEAEICYATIALSTDYDCWNEEEEDVTVEKVVETMKKNVSIAKAIIKKAIEKISIDRKCGCDEIAKFAVMTDKSKLNKDTLKKLEILYGKYLK